MNILFRVDASIQIGTGHFMRCLTLADALKQRGANIRFVSREMPIHLCSLLATKGMELVSLKSDMDASYGGDLAHSHWLDASQEQDAQATIQIVSDQTWDWLVVDHYALDARWESALRGAAQRIMVIDDIADRLHDCDVLLDQNFYADMQTRYTDKVPEHCQLLLGPRYALLRDEFRRLRTQVKPRTGLVRRIFVFFGGADADNYTGLAIKALVELNLKGLHVDVVIGAQHPCCEQIVSTCAQRGFFCHVQTDKMAEMIAAADLAIGAGGSTIWERCCLGLPTLSICTATNQLKQIADAAQEGLLYAPVIGTDLTTTIKNHTNAILENEYLRQFISRTDMQAVDGYGVMRIIGNLGYSGIVMRKANEDDSLKLFEWRNHPSVRLVSRNTEPITLENHQTWFAAALRSQDKVLLVGQIGETPIGVVRFDKQEDYAEVSIYLVPDANFSGQGRNLLLSSEQWLKTNRQEIRFIRACVLGNNEPSHRLFLGSDYLVDATHYHKKINLK